MFMTISNLSGCVVTARIMQLPMPLKDVYFAMFIVLFALRTGAWALEINTIFSRRVSIDLAPIGTFFAVCAVASAASTMFPDY
jgi:hypothetical protein